jgi:hypothetical protein
MNRDEKAIQKERVPYLLSDDTAMSQTQTR